MTTPFRTRVGQLVRLLSSDQVGEAGAAAQALHRAIVSAGLDIHRLAEIVEAGLPTRMPIAKSAPAPAVKARRHDGRPLTMDETLICDASDGLFRPCGCGSIMFEVMPGVGPHAAQLVCTACHRGGRWLKRSYFTGVPDAS
jgi:hypothetical protein